MTDVTPQHKPQLKSQDYGITLLRDFISQNFGIYFEEGKRWQLEAKLSRVMQNYPFTSFMEYYQYLIQKFYVNSAFTDPDVVGLVKAISNNETYFNREPAAYEAIRDYIHPQLFGQNSENFTRKIRVLSAGCSTGEEVYSIAITLRESEKFMYNLPLEIIGIDIDSHVLQRAQSGLYNSRSFRNMNGEMDKFKKYFSPGKNEDSFHVKEIIKDCVEFHQMNFLDLRALKGLGMFDIIFCRNVLIYFNDEAKQEAIHNFNEVMNPGGYLFLGHSESILAIDSDFAPIEKNECMFYQKERAING